MQPTSTFRTLQRNKHPLRPDSAFSYSCPSTSKSYTCQPPPLPLSLRSKLPSSHTHVATSPCSSSTTTKRSSTKGSSTHHQLLQGYLCRILLRVVDILPIVPISRLDDLMTGDGDSGGPGSAAAPAVRDDTEDWCGEVEAVTVVCVLGVS